MLRRAPCSATRSLEAVLSVGPPAFVGGLAAMHWISTEAFGGVPPFERHLVVAALVVVGLSLPAVAVSGSSREPGRLFLRTAGYTLLAAALCTPATLVALTLADGAPGISSLTQPFELFVVGPVILALATIFGLGLSLPLGLAFATSYSAMVTLTHWAREAASPAGRAVAPLVVAACWTLAAVGLAPLLPDDIRGLPPFPSPALVLGLAALIPAALSAHRLARLIAWTRRVRAGREPGWVAVPATPADDGLPSIHPFAPGRMIFARAARNPSAPYRDDAVLRRAFRA